LWHNDIWVIFVQTKKCTLCGVEKPLEEFSPNGRYIRSRCKICRAAVEREYRKNNTEVVRAKERERYHKNIEHERELLRKRYSLVRSDPEKWKQRLAYLREWKKKNKSWLAYNNTPAGKERRRRWQKANPINGAVNAQRRRARIKNANGEMSYKAILDRISYWGHRCWICGDKATEIDHIIPIAKGGSNWPSNIRPICSTCNKIKSDHFIHPYHQREQLLSIAERSYNLKSQVQHQ